MGLRPGPRTLVGDRSLGRPVRRATGGILRSDWLRGRLLGKWSVAVAGGCMSPQTELARAQAPYSSLCTASPCLRTNAEALSGHCECNKNVNTPPPPSTR